MVKKAAAKEEPKVVWEDPPRPTHGRYSEWNVVLQPLRDNPGKWARLKTYPTQGGAAGLKGRLQDGKKIQDRQLFDFRTAKLGPEEFAVYGRYVNGGSA